MKYYLSASGLICKTTGHGEAIAVGSSSACESLDELKKMIELANRAVALDEYIMSIAARSAVENSRQPGPRP